MDENEKTNRERKGGCYIWGIRSGNSRYPQAASSNNPDSAHHYTQSTHSRTHDPMMSPFSVKFHKNSTEHFHRQLADHNYCTGQWGVQKVLAEFNSGCVWDFGPSMLRIAFLHT